MRLSLFRPVSCRPLCSACTLASVALSVGVKVNVVCRAEARVSWCHRGHAPPPQPGQTEGSQQGLVFWESAGSASGWVSTQTHIIIHIGVSHACTNISCSLQIQSMGILETPWPSTSASWISTPGLWSRRRFWACPSHTSQVGAQDSLLL